MGKVKEKSCCAVYVYTSLLFSICEFLDLLVYFWKFCLSLSNRSKIIDHTSPMTGGITISFIHHTILNIVTTRDWF
jgi:hypothetical protein